MPLSDSNSRPGGQSDLPKGSRVPPRSRVAPGAGTVVVRAVGRLIEIGVTAGIRRDILLDAASLSEDDLRDPDARLPVSAAVALWQTLATYIADPAFGVRAGVALRVRQIGLVGYIAWFSGTLGTALRRIERYGPLLTQEMAFTLHSGRRELTLAVTRVAPGSGLWLTQDLKGAFWSS